MLSLITCHWNLCWIRILGFSWIVQKSRWWTESSSKRSTGSISKLTRILDKDEGEVLVNWPIPGAWRWPDVTVQHLYCNMSYSTTFSRSTLKDIWGTENDRVWQSTRTIDKCHDATANEPGSVKTENAWDTSLEYSKQLEVSSVLEHDTFPKSKLACAARVKTEYDDDKATWSEQIATI